jgi:6-phospho-3-hexuloisomerase
VSTLRAVRDELAAALAAVDDGAVPRFADALRSGSGSILLTGRGRSGLVAQMAAMRLMHLGLDTHCVGEPTAPPVRREDVLVVVSGSGRTPAATAFARTARDVGATVLVVTGAPGTELTGLADHVLVATPGPSAQHGGTLFEQLAHVVLDAVVLCLMERAPHAAARMATNHTNLE